MLWSHAGEKRKARSILHGLAPKAVKESRSKENADVQVSVGSQTVTGIYPTIHLCDTLLWIARCQREAGFASDARQTLYKALPLAEKVPGNVMSDYMPAYPRELSPLTAIAVSLHRLGDTREYRKSMKLALRRAKRLRMRRDPDWEVAFGEIAYAYTLVGDRKAAKRSLWNIGRRGSTLVSVLAALARIALTDARAGDLSLTFQIGQRFGNKDIFYQALKELSEGGMVEAVEQIQQWQRANLRSVETAETEKALAIAYARRGNRQQAIHHAQRVLALRDSLRKSVSNQDVLYREMELICEVPYLPEASKIIQYHLHRIETEEENRLVSYLAVGKALAAVRDKEGAYRSYQQALQHLGDLAGPTEGMAASIELNMLELGVVENLDLSQPWTGNAPALQMEVGRELMRRIKAERVERMAREADDAWILLGAAQALLNRPSLFVEK